MSYVREANLGSAYVPMHVRFSNQLFDFYRNNNDTRCKLTDLPYYWNNVGQSKVSHYAYQSLYTPEHEFVYVNLPKNGIENGVKNYPYSNLPMNIQSNFI